MWAPSLLLLAALSNPALPGTPQDVVPAPVKDIDIVEKLGAQVPKDLRFLNEHGREVHLGDVLDGQHPVVLTLAYYQCPMLCGLVLSGTAKGLQKTEFKLGQDYRAVTVSIDPKETPKMAAEAQRGITAPLVAKPGDEKNWAFWVAGDETSVQKLADSVGFKYAYDKETGQFAHAAVVFVLTPEGKVSRYFYGMDFAPRDLRLALVEASEGKVGTSFDRAILTCFKFDPATRKYGFYLSGFLRGGALAVFFALAITLSVLWRREVLRGTVS